MNENLFVTDFDGTLLTDAKQIHDRDLQTLSLLRADNTITAIATGRSLYSFQRALNQMGLTRDQLPVDYLVFSTGAGIYSLTRDRLLLSHAIPKADVREICTYFDRLGFDYMVHKSIPDTPHFLFKINGRDKNPDFHHRIDLYPSFGCPLREEADLYDHATEVLAIVPGGIDQEKLIEIQSDLNTFSVIHATSPLDHRSAWVEVFHKKVSKSSSIGWLARHLDICRAKVVSVGNDYNDRDLLEWSGLGLLVDNGPEDMKEGFGLVESNNCCGVSQAARVAGLLS